MKIIAIAAGKGGVGKSTAAVNLALALKESGSACAIIDADLYGPSIANMLGVQASIKEEEGYIIPASGLGVQYVSLALFPFGKNPSIVRAPIANHIIGEFLEKVRWNNIDYLLIDFPPGTGDIQLTIMQKISLDGVVLISTPQLVSLLDVKKAFGMFSQMEVPVLGMVENMSYFENGMEKHYIFGKGHVEAFCKEQKIPLLGSIPIEERVTECCDKGISLINKYPNSSSSLSYIKIQKNLEQELFKSLNTFDQSIGDFKILWKN
ncbi:ATP-binding protein [Candidatus Aerophobetes bacterium]|uniref:Iron-sulfur cluster carrier protein n=1 Tax=Aerophobetes bacterium TaxID=2030807 RepID=A0A2A4YHH1_UNCAE|nr:MAG: ATP-binding protein [Candidatus Aerophobetes bacterium]